MKFAVVAFLLLAFLNGAFSSYNETFVKYFVWPMAASAYSDHPELCVKDNFNSSDVSIFLLLNFFTHINENFISENYIL
jgi:hypothetical protein